MRDFTGIGCRSGRWEIFILFLVRLSIIRRYPHHSARSPCFRVMTENESARQPLSKLRNRKCDSSCFVPMTNSATKFFLFSLTLLFMFSKARSLFNSARIMPTYNGPTLPTAIHASQNLPSSSGSKEEGIFANGCFWGGEVRSYSHS